jgi:hypothetical protein
MSSVANAIIAQAQAMGVDPNIALQVAQAESGLNQSLVSPKGAIGIFQLMPSTAAQLGVNPYDPNQNIQGGITYLQQMFAQFGDPSSALAAYNCGPGCVQRLQSQYGSNWLAYAPAETQNYVAKILANVPAAPAPLTSGSGPITVSPISSGSAAQIPETFDVTAPAIFSPPADTLNLEIDLLPIAALILGGIFVVKLL